MAGGMCIGDTLRGPKFAKIFHAYHAQAHQKYDMGGKYANLVHIFGSPYVHALHSLWREGF